MRFGSLENTDRVHNSMKWIAAKLGIIYSTVVRIVSNYVKSGRVIEYLTGTRERIR